MRAAQLIFVRHGQTSGNLPNYGATMSGWTDLPLTELGRRQAERLREWLASEPEVAAIYSSPLQRARDTARILLGGSAARISLVPDLREIHCGCVDGLPISEVRKRYPDLWTENQRQLNPDFRWPGGESYREFRQRSLEASHSIARAHPGQRVLVVTHCGVISQVLGARHGLSPARWEAFRPGNASMTEVQWTGDNSCSIRFDLRAHLAGLMEERTLDRTTAPPHLCLEECTALPVRS